MTGFHCAELFNCTFETMYLFCDNTILVSINVNRINVKIYSDYRHYVNSTNLHYTNELSYSPVLCPFDLKMVTLPITYGVQ